MDSETHAQIIEILDRTRDMTVATIRRDGFPQATVVSFVHDDFRLYFETFPSAQKAQNINACDKVSTTITPPYRSWEEIEGLSLAGHAQQVTDPDEFKRVGDLMLERFPQAQNYEPPDGEAVILFRIDPVVISLLDYSRGFGHAELLDVQARLALG